jgi:hypothetical protein
VNLYGFVGGDPINATDPFGLSPDTLQIEDARLREAIAEQRKSNPKADEDFRALENSRQKFVVFNADAANCDQCPLAGFTWDLRKDKYADYAREHWPDARAVMSIRPSHPKAVADGIGKIAWHEAIHAKGIVKTGSKYSHGNPEFRRIP